MTDKPTPTTDLLKRCAEIHEWRSTGVLSGEALRDYAKRKWPDRHDTLQMAEHETLTEALAMLAKWGQPAQARADSVQEDAALWHWLAEYLVGTRTDLDDEIVASETVNDLRKLVEAAIKQGEKQ